VAAGPVVVQGGDYFGRTVNLAARIAARAGAGQVLVSQSVVESAPPEGVRFVELGELRLGGVRPSGAGPGGPPSVTSDASASPRRASPRKAAGRAGSAAARDHARTYDPKH
jgi:hypothetical protein